MIFLKPIHKVEVIRGFIDLLYSGFAFDRWYNIIKVLTSLIDAAKSKLIKVIKYEEFILQD